MNVSGLGFGCWVGENRASRTRAGQRSVGRSMTHRHSSGRAHIQRFMDGRASSRWIRAKRPAVACWSRREGAATRQCIPPCPWGGPLRCMSSATTSVGVLQKWRIERHRAPLHLCVSVVWCRWSVSGVHNVFLPSARSVRARRPSGSPTRQCRCAQSRRRLQPHRANPTAPIITRRLISHVASVPLSWTRGSPRPPRLSVAALKWAFT